MTQLCSISSYAAESIIFYAASVGRGRCCVLLQQKSVTGHRQLEEFMFSSWNLKARNIHLLLCNPRSALQITLSSQRLYIPLSCSFYSFIIVLLLPLPSLAYPPQVFPIPISVQRQGTGSGPRLDFHTVPSTECHIKLIRVNKCGGALLSRAPISLALPGSAHTDGLE